MTSNLQQLTSTLYPEQVWLEISPDEREQAWPQEHKYYDDAARWNAFKNRICLNKILEWFQSETGLELDEQPRVSPNLEAAAHLWEFVNGTAIEIGKTRLVLIPSDSLSTSEFYVPAEWVDIHSWIADYYVAVQLDIDEADESWLRILGFTSHKKLKQAGSFNKITRTYSLEREQVIEDLSLMLLASEFGFNERAAVEELPTLPEEQAESLLKQLADHSSYSPRLKGDFKQWCALLSNPAWREQLYEKRIENLDLQPVKEDQRTPEPVPAPGITERVSRIIKKVKQVGDTLTDFVYSQPRFSILTPQFAGGNNGIKQSDSKSVDELIKKLRNTREELECLNIAEEIVKLAPKNTIAIDTLDSLASKEEGDDKERNYDLIRWTAVSLLAKVAPDRLTDYREETWLVEIEDKNNISSVKILLSVDFVRKTDKEVCCLLRLDPSIQQTKIPEELEFFVTDRSISPNEIYSGTEPDYVVGRCMTCIFSLGDCFSVTVKMGSESITLDFVA